MSKALSFSALSVAHQFSKAAQAYDKVAFVQQEIGRRLLDRLDYMKLTPNYILDIGAGTGLTTQVLKTRFPESSVVGLDLAFGMSQTLQQHATLLSVCADMHQLPFAHNTFDLIVSNCTLQWSQSPQAFFANCLQALKPNGMLLLSTFGPDTLKELRAAFRAVSQTPHDHDFIDMHDLGDQCLSLGYLDPVLDREDIILSYQSIGTLLKDLKRLGASNLHPNRAKGLMGKKKWQGMIEYYSQHHQTTDQFPATYEVLYCHAVKKPHQPDQGDIDILTCHL